MDKTKYKEWKNGKKKEFKKEQKNLKVQFKSDRPSFKERVCDRLIPLVMSFNGARKKIGNRVHAKVNDARKKIGNKIHSKKVAINDLTKKVDYIVDSLKATLGTTDEIRAKTIEDIVENIDDL